MTITVTFGFRKRFYHADDAKIKRKLWHSYI